MTVKNIYKTVEDFGQMVLRLPIIATGYCKEVGAFCMFFVRSMGYAHPKRLRYNLVLRHFKLMGVDSFFIIGLTGLFTGMVITLQMGRAFEIFQAETLTGAVAAISISKELAPVFTGIMFTARVGSSMAAQLGSMRVTQQIDALSSMAVNPREYLVLPRMLAAILVLPLLTGLFDFIAMVGSYIVGVKLLYIDHASFMERIVYYMEVPYIVEGLFKAAVFGFIISAVSCYQGYYAKGGAEGVGRVTTQAVVVSSVCILVFDYFLTALLF